ncbi:MAG: ankyrin repeat domain-containing protein [Spirochaetales bacterium]|nr:ankyrin repeat domain-containing protein [Spirochaetales bacterium]
MRQFLLLFLLISALSACVSGSGAVQESGSAKKIANAPDPIFLEVSQGNIPKIGTYLQAGGDPNLKNNIGWPLLQIAAEQGKAEAVKVLLAAHADIDELDGDNRTALMKSCYYGYKETVKILLDAGADYSLKDNLGESALRKSVYRGHKEVEALLRQSGAQE